MKREDRHPLAVFKMELGLCTYALPQSDEIQRIQL
jgi:hypothetical protein